MTENQTTAQSKLKVVQKELEDLVVRNYVPPLTKDEPERATSPSSAEYEFSEAYSDPEKAIALIVESWQLDREILGLPRLKIVSTAKALEIILKNQSSDVVNDRILAFKQDTIIPPPEIKIIESSGSII